MDTSSFLTSDNDTRHDPADEFAHSLKVATRVRIPLGLQRIRAKVRERTDRRFASRELHDVVADLNPVLRGWGAYFRYGNSSRKFSAIDEYVYWQMTKLASVKYATRGRLRTSRFTYVWLHDLGIYRLTGNVRSWGLTHA